MLSSRDCQLCWQNFCRFFRQVSNVSCETQVQYATFGQCQGQNTTSCSFVKGLADNFMHIYYLHVKKVALFISIKSAINNICQTRVADIQLQLPFASDCSVFDISVRDGVKLILWRKSAKNLIIKAGSIIWATFCQRRTH